MKRQSISKLVDTVGAVFDKRDQAVEKLRELQTANDNHLDALKERKMNQDLSLEVEDVQENIAEMTQLTKLQKMQKAMGAKPNQAPRDLAAKFIK